MICKGETKTCVSIKFLRRHSKWKLFKLKSYDCADSNLSNKVLLTGRSSFQIYNIILITFHLDFFTKDLCSSTKETSGNYQPDSMNNIFLNFQYL